MQKRHYAKVQWTGNDVIQNCKQFDIEITRESARKVLRLKERDIVDAMVQAGWQVIEDTLLQSRR